MQFGTVFWTHMVYAMVIFLLIMVMVSGFILYGFYSAPGILSNKIDSF